MSSVVVLELPYFPSRSKDYQKRWARSKSNPSGQVSHLVDFDRMAYHKAYNQRVYVKEKGRKGLLRLSVINLLGGQCVRCGECDLRCLQLDHINGGGNKETKTTFNRNRRNMYRYYINNPKELYQKYQILCANCNWKKRYDNHESPHFLHLGVF